MATQGESVPATQPEVTKTEAPVASAPGETFSFNADISQVYSFVLCLCCMEYKLTPCDDDFAVDEPYH